LVVDLLAADRAGARTPGAGQHPLVAGQGEPVQRVVAEDFPVLPADIPADQVARRIEAIAVVLNSATAAAAHRFQPAGKPIKGPNDIQRRRAAPTLVDHIASGIGGERPGVGRCAGRRAGGAGVATARFAQRRRKAPCVKLGLQPFAAGILALPGPAQIVVAGQRRVAGAVNGGHAADRPAQTVVAVAAPEIARQRGIAGPCGVTAGRGFLRQLALAADACVEHVAVGQLDHTRTRLADPLDHPAPGVIALAGCLTQQVGLGHLLAQRVVAILPGAGIRIGLAYLAAQRVVDLGVENGAATGVAADGRRLDWKRTSVAQFAQIALFDSYSRYSNALLVYRICPHGHKTQPALFSLELDH